MLTWICWSHTHTGQKNNTAGWLQLLGLRWIEEIAQLSGADPYSQDWNHPSLRNWAGKVDESISGKWGLICAASEGKIPGEQWGRPQLGPWIQSQNHTSTPAAISHSGVRVWWTLTGILHIWSVSLGDNGGKEIKRRQNTTIARGYGQLCWHCTAQMKKIKYNSSTHHFSQGGSEHVSANRCHLQRGESSTGAQQRLDAVVGDKESSSCNQTEPQSGN